MMKRYIEQLIEDLQEIRSKSTQNLSLFFKVPEMQDYDLYNDEEHEGIKVTDLIGMEKFFFPNVDYLTDAEAEVIVVEFENVFNAYGLNPIFEDCVTARIKYGHLRHALNHQVFPVENQMVDIEMCDYLPQYCPMHELCSNYNAQNVCCELRRRA
ncbi:hypothetical protein J1N10_05795 [Carboxylicivirga sp. A043]|uniref:hypothetical protein n=1 Tax=Carboxylicivirga litoralis TaxID=2816963 RepID=UPI0021CB5CE8|nr:hypothetical protein [Carboxylicivirga sp. A043]MCU4155480.1 hypothetical protein [Carboxylicivirga sp. A043]